MLKDHVERYLELHHSLGYKFRDTKRELRSFAKLAQSRGESYVSAVTSAIWADQAPSPYARSTRMRRVVQFAKFLHAEDPQHEVPSLANYHHQYSRPLPYIYTPLEIRQIMLATSNLQKTSRHRRWMYKTLIGLISSTGLRLSEALNLQLPDIEAGTLRINDSKFGKSRLVPLHPTTQAALEKYLSYRRQCHFEHGYLFFSRGGTRLSQKTLHYNFSSILKIAGIAPKRVRRPRIHDLRHTFATRALQQCQHDRKRVEKHFVALSTYLGHVDIRATYWYLEATPELMTDIAITAEQFIGGIL